jgi:biotin operon repressor
MAELLVNDEKNIFSENHRNFSEREEELEKMAEAEKEQREREKKSPYRDWYQFNREYAKEMRWLAKKHPSAQVLLLFLLEKMDRHNALMCSYQVLQEALGMSRQTIANAVKILKTHNFITVLKSGGSNIYVVNKQLAWSSWGTNYSYAEFDARIIVSKSEQEEIDVKSKKIKQIIIPDEAEKKTEAKVKSGKPNNSKGKTKQPANVSAQ